MARQPNTIYSLNAMMSEYNFMKNKDSSRRLLQTVLSNAEKICQMNLEDAALFCNVSVSTFLRFCKEMQFSSFTEFKQRLKSESDRYANKYSSNFLENEAELIGTLADQSIRQVESWRSALDYESCVRLVELMHQAEKVFFFDIRYPQTRIPLQNHLAHTGKRVYFSADFAEQLDYLAEADAHSIVVIDTHEPDRDVNAQHLLMQAIASPAFVAVIMPTEQTLFRRRSDLALCYGAETIFGILKSISNELTCLYLSILYETRYISKRY